MSKIIKRVLLSSMASTAISLSLLYATVMLYNHSINYAFELVLAVLVVRLIQGFLGFSATGIDHGNISSAVIGTITHETKFSIGLLAVCFLFQWQLFSLMLFQFIAANLALKTALTFLIVNSVQKNKTNEQNAEPDHSNQKAIVLGTGELARQAVNGILDSIESDISVIGFLDYKRTGMWSYRDIPLLGQPEMLKKIISLEQVDYVIVAVELNELPQAKETALLAEQMGVTVVVMSQPFDLKSSRSKAVNVGNILAVEYSSAPVGKFSLAFKSLSDRIGALIGLILFLPIMIAAAIAIKIDSRGPVFFRQSRSGINGKTFKLWKFRTMEIDAEKMKAQLLAQNEMSGPVFKITNDPRVTKVGHYLRKYSIDEFPQFMNVFMGDMSLVGPRPPLPAEVADFEPWQHRKLSVKPGLTCLWQADGRNDIDFEDWMKMDLKYIDNWSLWEDTKIIARTIPTVLKGSGK